MKTDVHEKIKICVVGLGYVGLPLAIEFAKVFPTIGFDTLPERVLDLNRGWDSTGEVDFKVLAAVNRPTFSFNAADLKSCNVFIVCVPTPIDANNKPDLTALRSASELVGKSLSPGGHVVFESTVYPGATEEVCVPILEKISGLTCNQEFFVGYSPERINPGDKARPLVDIKKVTSGSTKESAAFIDALYRKIITAGTYLAPSIRVAEAAKVIENTQRDLNIALINELSLIFDRVGIDTEDVLRAAETKWNFMPFRPGLVGGHCIGVDPYYLTHKATELGYLPELILAGRSLNDRMSGHMATKLAKYMAGQGKSITGSRVCVLGASFKEDCPDLRNTKVLDLVSELRAFGATVDVCDPVVNPIEMEAKFGCPPVALGDLEGYDVLVVAVGHKQFVEHGVSEFKAANNSAIIFDLKYIFNKDLVDLRC